MVKKNVIVNKVSEDSSGEGLSSPELNEIKFVHQSKKTHFKKSLSKLELL